VARTIVDRGAGTAATIVVTAKDGAAITGPEAGATTAATASGRDEAAL
jgi:hypothetical protein